MSTFERGPLLVPLRSNVPASPDWRFWRARGSTAEYNFPAEIQRVDGMRTHGLTNRSCGGTAAFCRACVMRLSRLHRGCQVSGCESFGLRRLSPHPVVLAEPFHDTPGRATGCSLGPRCRHPSGAPRAWVSTADWGSSLGPCGAVSGSRVRPQQHDLAARCRILLVGRIHHAAHHERVWRCPTSKV